MEGFAGVAVLFVAAVYRQRSTGVLGCSIMAAKVVSGAVMHMCVFLIVAYQTNHISLLQTRASSVDA